MPRTLCFHILTGNDGCAPQPNVSVIATIVNKEVAIRPTSRWHTIKSQEFTVRRQTILNVEVAFWLVKALLIGELFQVRAFHVAVIVIRLVRDPLDPAVPLSHRVLEILQFAGATALLRHLL